MEGAIPANFPAPGLGQRSSEIRERTFIEEPSVTVPQLQDEAQAPLAQVCQRWKAG